MCLILLIIKDLKYLVVINLLSHESKHFTVRNDLYMFIESGRTNIFIIKMSTAPRLSLKIRYNFLGGLVDIGL